MEIYSQAELMFCIHLLLIKIHNQSSVSLLGKLYLYLLTQICQPHIKRQRGQFQYDALSSLHDAGKLYESRRKPTSAARGALWLLGGVHSSLRLLLSGDKIIYSVMLKDFHLCTLNKTSPVTGLSSSRYFGALIAGKAQVVLIL